MIRCARCSDDLLDLAVFCPTCGHPHEPDFEQLLSRRLSGRYQIHERLGEGGLSTVFLATDTHTDQSVVVKVSDPRQLVRHSSGEAPDATILRNYWTEMLARMRREVVALVNIQHTNIVRIFDTDLITDELRYIIMERLHGHTLRDEIAVRGRLDVRTAIRLTEAIADGLSTVHARGIIHRDLNPRNLFLADCELRTANPFSDTEATISRTVQSLPSQQAAIRNLQSAVVKIIDFGIARIPQPPGAPPFTQYAILSGTVSYASPEQCQNLPLDHRSDIYSLGVVLYEMLTGQRPFTGLSPTEIAVKQIRDEPVSLRTLVPDLPAGLATAVQRALAKDPQQRPQSAAEMVADLHACRDGVSARVVVPLAANAQEPGESLATILSDLPVTAALPVARTSAQTMSVQDEPAGAESPDESLPAEAGFGSLHQADRMRKRKVIAFAAMALLVLLAGLLSGSQIASSLQPWLGMGPAMETAENTMPVPDATPDGITVESLTGQRAGTLPTGRTTAATTSSGSATVTTGLPAARTFTEKLKALAASIVPSIATKPEPQTTPLPQTVPPSARPQMPPAPAPTIMAARDPQPRSNPNESYGPVRVPVAAENDEPADKTPDGSRQEPSDYPYPSHRTGNAEPERESEPPASPPGWQREPNSTDRQAGYGDREDDPEVPDAGPKVITWSGHVSREREIRLELPGVPGEVNIPRSYRTRVGMVEPPGPQNGWRCVVLRVFGKGRTSIVVQWWPRTRQATKSTRGFLTRRVVSPVNQASRAVAQQFSRIQP